MDRRQLLLGMTALALSRNFSPHFLLSPQNAEPTAQPKNLSDRERDGLRGPVKTCVGGTTTTEYDPDGRMLSTHAVEPDGREWGSTQTYDSAGRLLRISSRNWDGSSTVQIYSYDEAGRLVGIADGSGNRTDFHYDEQGRKMSVQSFAPKPHEEGAVGVDLLSGSVFEAAQSGVGVPGVPEVVASPLSSTNATSPPKCKSATTREPL
jgi:YD repeat-containing protein